MLLNYVNTEAGVTAMGLEHLPKATPPELEPWLAPQMPFDMGAEGMRGQSYINNIRIVK